MCYKIGYNRVTLNKEVIMDALCLLEIARKDAAEAGESDYAALIEKVIAQLKEDLKELDSLRKT
jgi:hypothetical protein